eukprot:GEZU01010531.1.p1 GENE.GEZU01010531.1~~GEZU01010531.1.p1  ORF type:complete len:268 (-),score=55.79 GEZU01010531.1:275-1078(-)
MYACNAFQGAWMTEDKSDHANWGTFLAGNDSPIPAMAVAVVNYHLCPRKPMSVAQEEHAKGISSTPSNYNDLVNPHPIHVRDCARAIAWLCQKQNADKYNYDPNRIIVSGHSAGAHIAALLSCAEAESKFGLPTSSGVKIAGFIGLEGIYDLERLVNDFPLYQTWFVEHTFGVDPTHQRWREASPTNIPFDPKLAGKWLVVHSRGDRLVLMNQAEKFVEHLKQQNVDVEFFEDPAQGDHDDVIKNFGNKGDAVTKAILDFIPKCCCC